MAKSTTQDDGRRSRAPYRAVFDHGFQCQFLIDGLGCLCEASQAALDDQHTTIDGVRGRPLWECFWWTDDGEAVTRLQAAIASARQGEHAHYEEGIRDRSGAVTILEVAVKLLPEGDDDEGDESFILVQVRDVTGRRRYEAALQEVDVLMTMGRVASRVAHEINNPLAGIQNSFLLLKGAIPDSHPHYAYVGAIEREIGRIAAVTRQLYETYHSEPERSGETSIHTLLGDAAHLLEQANREARVRIKVTYDQVPGVIAIAAPMLRQIVFNVLQLAVESSPSDSVVTVTVDVIDRKLRLMVRDEGANISSTVREASIGIAPVKRTVMAAGGTLTFQDLTGGGRLATIALPLGPLDAGMSR